MVTRIFDKLGWVVAALVSLAVLAALAGLVAAGPLDPTAPPGSTGKNVITSLPFTISQEGSYVVNGNLTGVSGQNGVTVNAANVTIDLQGFELVGVSGALSGINGTQANLTVRNGTVRNWPGNGILGVASSVVDNIQAISNGTNGIGLGDRARVTNCLVYDSVSGYGISLGNDSTLSECDVRGSGDVEIFAGNHAVLEHCLARGTGAAGNNTNGNGIQVGDDSIVRGCAATNNGALGSQGDEIKAGDRSLIEDCVANGWTGSVKGQGNGIVVGSFSTVRHCNAVSNVNSGIYSVGDGNRYEGNLLASNGEYGINLPVIPQSSISVGLMNDATGNASGNYNISTNYVWVITSVTTANNPWSNLSH